MLELTRSEIEKLVALQSGKYKKDVAIILDTYYAVLKQAVLAGYKISIPSVGTLSNSEVKAKGERRGINPTTCEEIVLPAHDNYNKPTFRFKRTIKEEMRKETEGQVF